MHREPDVGFHPGSPGSCPEPKAGAKLLRHRGCPTLPFFKKRFYLFIHEKHTHIQREREREREAGRGKSRLRARSPMWDSIPGFQEHALG